MSYTKIWRNEALPSMRALALSQMDRVQWRHHGIGVLQGYIREDVEPEVRLHIWSRRLLKPGMETSGDSHDHRFDMVSHVLAGFVIHEELIETPDPEGSHAAITVTHARAAAETKFHGPTATLEGRYRVRPERWIIHEGFSYSFPALKFHHSPLPLPDDLVAVTCVEKHNQRPNPGRVIYPLKHEPVMAFGHDQDPALIRAIVEEAREALRRT